MTEYQESPGAQVRKQLIEALGALDKARNVERDGPVSNCDIHLEHAQEAADKATAALAAGDLDTAEHHINNGFTELAVYEYCVVTSS